MKIALSIFSGLLIITPVIQHIKKDDWWIRMFDFPHLQTTVLGVFCLFLYLILPITIETLDIVLMILLGVVILYQLYQILPYTLFYPFQVKNTTDQDPKNCVSLLVSNVYTYNGDCQKSLHLFKEISADLLLLVETNKFWKEHLSSLEKIYPYTIHHPLDNTYGILFYSKLPLINSEVRFMIEEDVPSIHTYIRMRSGVVFKFYGIHPRPPSPTENDRSTERDAELVLVGQEAKNEKAPVIVAGDMNDVAWSHTTNLFQKISGLLDPRVGRGLFNTFHAKYFFLRWPLDHIFHSYHFKLNEIRRLPYTGSDHFPMYLSLCHAPDLEAIDEIPEPDQEELEEAREKVKEAK
jgi:endonuclease/exonuclease/phosphatase (EEP) superfamily protein YafD